jgi:lipopolysaccharide export system protein LptA
MCLLASGASAQAQQLDLTHGGPIDITAQDGIEWRQAEQKVIARGDARAQRGAVTVNADTLTAWYRKKANPGGSDAGAAPAHTKPGDAAASNNGSTNVGSANTGPAIKTAAQPDSIGLGGDSSSEGNEIYRLQADGKVRIFTQTDQAQGDKATYDLDQAVLVLTGRDLKLTTPNDTLTARDDLEYWPQKHMAVARGNAVVLTNDARRIAGDTLVAYLHDSPNPPPPAGGTTPVAAKSPTSGPSGPEDPLAASGKVERVEAFGHVSIRTPTDTVTGDRGVYVPDTGMARLGGNVRITRGQNQLNGAEADVNMKTGIARLVARPSQRVAGLVVPNDETNKSLTNDPTAAAIGGTGSTAKPARPPAATAKQP